MGKGEREKRRFVSEFPHSQLSIDFVRRVTTHCLLLIPLTQPPPIPARGLHGTLDPLLLVSRRHGSGTSVLYTSDRGDVTVVAVEEWSFHGHDDAWLRTLSTNRGV